MALALRLFLLLLLAVALPARAAQAAPLQARRAGVSAERTSQAPLLVPAHKPGSHLRGPPMGKNKATGHKKAREPSEHMRQMLKEKQQAGQDLIHNLDDLEILLNDSLNVLKNTGGKF